MQIIAPLLDNTLSVIRQRGFFAFIRFFYFFTATVPKSVFWDTLSVRIREDVDELGKFVQGGAAEEAPQREQPLLIGQELPVFILPVVHRFEFDDLEQSSPVPYARLKKKRGFPCRKYKKYRNGQQQRNEDDESYSGKEASKKRFADMYVHKRRGRVTGLQIRCQ